MRYQLPLILLLLAGLNLTGQTIDETVEGTVTYLTSQNVYVKFPSTANMAARDTLFIKKTDKLIPVLVIRELSSTSCVCTPLFVTKLNLGDKILFRQQQGKAQPVKSDEPVALPIANPQPQMQVKDTVAVDKPIEKKQNQSFHGYLSLASYTNFSNTSAANLERMQYTFSLNARNIGSTGLSVESYITFYQKMDSAGWSEIKNDLFNGLKIYNLAVNYDFNKTYSLLLGRKINPKISNMGAVDGLQFEMRFKPVTIGIIGGTRPDYEDYSFNPNLIQYGGYLYNEISTKHGLMQSTLAFVQQNNSGKTDRSFLYLQHSNSVVKNLTFFGTVEFDLYNKVKVQTDSLTQDSLKKKNAPRLTNLYLSLRYRVFRQLSVSLSYSNRQNIVYYETYKNYLDKLLEFETTQGYLFQVNYRPVKRLFIGATAGYRFQKNDPRPSSNLNVNITYSQIPRIGISATASVILLKTGYLSGNVYGLGISRDFIKGKVYGAMTYKYVNYQFSYSEENLQQNVGELTFTWRIYKRISLSLYYEGTFEKQNQFNRIYAQLYLGF